MTAKPSPVSLTPRQRPGSPARVFVQLRPRAGPRSGGLGWLSRRRSAARPNRGTEKALRAVPPASRALSPSPRSFDASLPALVLWALPLLLPALLLSFLSSPLRLFVVAAPPSFFPFSPFSPFSPLSLLLICLTPLSFPLCSFSCSPSPSCQPVCLFSPRSLPFSLSPQRPPLSSSL